MSVNAEKFSLLLHEGVTAIQKHESRNKKKTRTQIHEEIGRSIGRKASTIEHFLQKHVPTSYQEIEILAKTIFSRGDMEEKWLRDFLLAAGHTRVDELVTRLSVSSVEDKATQSEFQCRRFRHDYHVTLYPDRSVISAFRIAMQATSLSEVSTIRHRSFRSSLASKVPKKLDFLPISRSDNGAINHRIFTNIPDFLQWNVVFDPPLSPNEKAVYEYRHTMTNVHPWTIEECSDLFKQGLISSMWCTTDVMIGFPTDLLCMSVTLPNDYDIALPLNGGFRTTVQTSDNLIEKTRLIKENAFQAKHDERNNQWTLTLTVKNPKQGYAYYLEWIPPSEKSLAGR